MIEYSRLSASKIKLNGENYEVPNFVSKT